MLTRIVKGMKQYLLLDHQHLQTPDKDTWKLSVLRLILLSGVILTFAITAHASYIAYAQELYYILALTLGFSGVIWLTLALGKGKIKLASALLTMVIMLVGLSILLFTVDQATARYGLLFFFTLPIILRLFYGNKAAAAGMVFNIIPFVLLLRTEPLGSMLGMDIHLPATHIYLSALVFLFFNFCLPVAVIRVMASLERQSSLNRAHSKRQEKLVNQYQEIFNNGGTPSFFCDQQGRILQANKGGRKLIHQSQPECDYIHQLFVLNAPLVAGETVEAPLRADNDTLYQIQPASLVHHKKQLIHCFDISQTTAADKRIGELRREHFTKHYSDALTGTKNHHYWSHQFVHQQSHQYTVVLIKLASLKDINLQYGFSRGDEVLADAAALLRSQLPTTVNIFRFPGAKFLLSVDKDQCSIEDIPDWLERHLPLTVMHRRDDQRLLLPLHWRAGYCSAEGYGAAAVLAESCEIALSQTNRDTPFTQYDSKIVKLIRQDTQKKDKIKQLLDDESLAIWLQPQVNQRREIISFEVLARLKEKLQNQILQPYQFLPEIEKNEWHLLFTQQVVERAVTLLENWPETLPVVPLAVNLSGPELLDDIFYEKLLRRYSENTLLRDRLKLELTETSVIASLDETKKRLTSLANVGATIIIDDFGTGHASLSQLIDLSASVLKVDRYFVKHIESSERHRKIVRMTLELAKSLNMQAIAEGVETKEQLALLTDMGFTRFQGFYFGKPAPISYWAGKLNAKAS